MEVGEAAIFHDVDGAKTQLPLLDRFWQAECRLERSYSRAQRELERLQTSRRNSAQQPEEPPPAPAAEAPSAEVGQASSSASSTPAPAAPFEIQHPAATPALAAPGCQLSDSAKSRLDGLS
jgi:hypothetical protein